MTEEEEAQIVMFMRVLEFLRKHDDIIKDKSAILIALADLKNNMQQLFEALSEKDRDQVLESYAEELAFINE